MAAKLVFQEILRHWLFQQHPDPKKLYAEIRPDMSARFPGSVSGTSASNFLDWTWNTLYISILGKKPIGLKGSPAPTDRFEEVYRLPHHRQDILPKLKEAHESGMPVMSTINTRMLGFRIFSDQLIRPKKTDGRRSWLVACTRMRLLSKMPGASAILDPLDEKLVSLFAEGETAKTIARDLNISYRSVEHRLSHMRQKHGVKSLPQLIAHTTASG